MEPQAAQAPPAKATKAASLIKARETLPSVILKNGTWDSHTEKELMKKMMDSLGSYTSKVVEWALITGVKGDVEVDGKTLKRKDIPTFRRMLQAELSLVQPIIELNRAVSEAPYKTPMGLCVVDRRLVNFFLGDGKKLKPVNLGPAYEIEYSDMEAQLMEKIGNRRRTLMRQRYIKAGGDKNRPLETFVPPFEIPKSSDSLEHIFRRLDKDVLELVHLDTGYSTAPIISALLSLYFRKFGRNVKMQPKANGAEGAVRETPKVMFDERMKECFGGILVEESEDGKRLFSVEDMTDRGIGYLQAIQRLVSECTEKRKNLKGEDLAKYDRMEMDVQFMEQIQDGARAAIETKRYHKETMERENRAKPKH
jgi:hypothetical protein